MVCLVVSGWPVAARGACARSVAAGVGSRWEHMAVAAGDEGVHARLGAEHAHGLWQAAQLGKGVKGELLDQEGRAVAGVVVGSVSAWRLFTAKTMALPSSGLRNTPLAST